MIKTLLFLRFKQIFKGITGIGLIRTIFLIGIIGFLGLALYTYTSDELTAKIITGCFMFLIILIHLKRRDKSFLKSSFPNYKSLMLCEYIVLAIPILICLLIHTQWSSLIAFSGLMLIINLNLKPKQSNLNTKIQALIQLDAFEWKAGLRKYFFIIVPAWILALITSPFIASVPIVIFLIGLLTISFFEIGEPLQVLMSYELSSKKLLYLKVKRQFQLFSITTAPLIGVFLIFHFDKWYIPLIEYIIFAFLHLYVIMTKYAFFEPNKKSIAAQTYNGIGVLGIAIPFFIPVIWLLTIRFYLKSIINLNNYLNDYNN